MRRKVLIVGCGYVGEELARLCVSRGFDVFGLRRSVVGQPAGVQAISADICSGRGFETIPEGIYAVIYLVSAESHTEDSYQRAYVQGLQSILSYLEARGEKPARFLFASSTGVYGQDHGEWVDEASPTEPSEFNGKILCRAEALLGRSAVPGVSVRFGGIYGPGRTRLIQQVRNGQASIPAGEVLFTNRIHRDDCAAILLHLIELSAVHNCYVAVDDEPCDRGLVYRWVADRLRIPIESAAPFDHAFHRGKRCQNLRLRNSGYNFLYPTFREGYGKLIESSV